MKGKKFLIAGAAGQLGKEFVRQLSTLGATVVAPVESEFDITDQEAVSALIVSEKPDYLVNCAAYNDVEAAEDNADLAYRVNDTAVGILAQACREHSVFLVHFSTDYVFDGQKQQFYTEEDATNPLNVYGKSKLQGERRALELHEHSLVFRVSWVFGQGTQNFLYKLDAWAGEQSVLRVNAEEVSIPTYTEDIVATTVQSLETGLSGLYHLTNGGYASRYELARYYAKKMEWDNVIIPVNAAFFPVKAVRPSFSCLSNQKLCQALNTILPDWEDAVERFVLTSEPVGV